MVEFYCHRLADLVFHLFAHAKVDNASDLYSPAYIWEIAREKGETDSDLAQQMQALMPYYNQEFDRLCLLQFFPFFVQDEEEYRRTLLGDRRFCEEDRARFLLPFCDCMEREKEFYDSFWDRQRERWEKAGPAWEKQLATRLGKYRRILEPFGKTIQLYWSLSLTRNGRGFRGRPDAFGVCVPFPASSREMNDVFFQILHECTHQFTDAWLGTEISMRDGSHDLSERVVLFVDDRLVAAVEPQAREDYRCWVKGISGAAAGREDVPESDFCTLPEPLRETVQRRLRTLLG